MEVDDFVGGMLLLGSAVLQLLSIARAYKEKMVAGVHPATVFYWMSLNAFYVYFFAKRGFWWSTAGEVALLVVFAIWVGQYFFYKRKRVE